jgi:protein-arginine kinase activator protein McsA
MKGEIIMTNYYNNGVVNPVYICEDCGKNLGDKYSHIKNKKTPCVNIIKGKAYCNKCADRYYDEIQVRS